MPNVASKARKRPPFSRYGPRENWQLHGFVLVAVVLAIGAAVAMFSTEGAANTEHAAVEAYAETDPVPNQGDAADDAAIWVNPQDPAASTVIGTDKEGGIAVYDLSGRELQYLADGNLNSVDLRAGFELDGESITVVTASNRTDDSIAVYQIDPGTGLLSDVSAGEISVGMVVYGLCMYRDAAGRIYSFVNSKEGEVEQWQLFDDGTGLVDAVLVRSFDVGSQLEGCVADDELGRLYIGEENVGIWEYSADPGGGTEGTLIAAVDEAGPLVAEVEGLTIAYGSEGTGYLLASSQGNDSFVVFQRSSPHTFVFTFEVVDGSMTDGVTETDGIDVTTANLGPAFPSGLFVAHDDDNGDENNQNFKLVPWDEIDSQIPATSDIVQSLVVRAGTPAAGG